MTTRRVTQADLERMCGVLNRSAAGRDYSIGYAYGQPRLESHAGSRDVSPRLSKPELYQWLHAFFDGIITGRETVPTED